MVRIFLRVADQAKRPLSWDIILPNTLPKEMRTMTLECFAKLVYTDSDVMGAM